MKGRGISLLVYAFWGPHFGIHSEKSTHAEADTVLEDYFDDLWTRNSAEGASSGCPLHSLSAALSVFFVPFCPIVKA
jgi:hypothetical protein